MQERVIIDSDDRSGEMEQAIEHWALSHPYKKIVAMAPLAIGREFSRVIRMMLIVETGA